MGFSRLDWQGGIKAEEKAKSKRARRKTRNKRLKAELARRRLEKECFGKEKYPTYNSAIGAIRIVGGPEREYLDAYRCSYCENYHLGHP